MFECELPKQYFVTMFKHCNYNTSFQICKKQGDDCEDQSTPPSPRPLTKARFIYPCYSENNKGILRIPWYSENTMVKLKITWQS